MRRSWHAALAIAGASIITGLAAPGAAAASAPHAWAAPVHTDPQRGGVVAVSCASATDCTAVDTSGGALHEGAEGWSGRIQANPDGGTTDVSCPTATLCVAVDANGSVQLERAGTWSAPQVIDPGQQLVAVSCPTATSCTAADASGVLTWDGRTWSGRTSVTSPITDIGCPTSSFCVVVDQSGRIYDEVRGSWRQERSNGLYGRTTVSCTSASFCLAMDQYGTYARFDGQGWTRARASKAAYGGTLTGMACGSPTSCVASGSTGAVYRWRGPSSGWVLAAQPGWQGGTVDCARGATSCSVVGWTQALTVTGSSVTAPVTVDPFSGLPVALSCAADPTCTLIDEFVTAQRFDGQRWGANVALPTVNDYAYPLGSVSCPTASFCVAVGNGERTATIDMWNGSTWSVEVAPRGLTSVSCPSVAFCIAVAPFGYAERWDGHGWTEITLHHAGSSAGYWSSVSCVAASCVAVSNNGYAAVYANGRFSDPAVYDPVTSTRPVGGDPAPAAPTVSCPQRLTCVAVDGFGDVQSFSAGAWSEPQVIDDVGLAGLSCPTTAFCQAVDGSGRAVTRHGSTWAAPTTISSVDPKVVAVSCPTAGFCEAVTADGWTVRWS